MALDPAGFLAQAPLLMEAGGEAGYRSAINRAYYACHLAARDCLFEIDAAQWGGPGRPSHRAVVRSLRRLPSMGDASEQLERLRKAREIADYVRDTLHLEAQALFRLHGASDWRGLAQVSLLRAREAFAALQSLRAR